MKNLSAVCLVAGTFSALVCSASTWTGGGGDGRWVNAANWSDGIPGIYANGGVTVTNEVPAVFDVTGNANRTIDLSDLVGVRYLEIAGGDEPYVFGTSDAQKLGINHDGAICVKEGAHCPVLAATLLKAANAEYGYWSTPSGRNRPGFAVTNLSSEVFSIGKYSGYVGLNPSEAAILLCGTGEFRFTENANTSGGAIHVCHNTSGRVTIDGCTISVREWVCNVDNPLGGAVPRELVITAGGKLSASTAPYGMLQIGKHYRIIGDGDLTFTDGLQVMTDPQLAQYAAIGMARRWIDTPNSLSADVAIGCRCSVQNPTLSSRPAGYQVGMPFSGRWGTVHLNGDASGIKGDVTLFGAKLVVDALGMKADNPRTGSGDFIMADNAHVDYTGSGDVTDRGIIITNANPMVSNEVNINAKMNNDVPYWVRAEATGCVIQEGTGVLRMQGAVNASVTNSLLVLQGPDTAAEGWWESVLQDNPCGQDGLYCALSLSKQDSGTWRIKSANTMSGTVTVEAGTLVLDGNGSFDNAAAIVMKGGNLELAGVDSAASCVLPPMTVSGTAKLTIGANRTVTIGGIARTGSGKVDVLMEMRPSKLVVTGLAEGDAPAWLTVNGQPAKYSADVGLYSEAYSIWTSAVDGNWTESAKWSPDAVPASNRPAVLPDNGGAYTVTIDGNRSIATNLTVGSSHDSANTATLAVDGANVDVNGSCLKLQGNGRIALENGANVVYDNHESVPYTFKDKILTIDKGAEMTVSGGASLVFTNFHGQVTIGGTMTDNTGRLTVDGGRMAFFTRPRQNSSAPRNNESLISILPGGTLEFKGASSFDIGNGAANDFYGVLHNKGGKVIVGGETLMRLWNVNYLDCDGMDTKNGDWINGVYASGPGETVFKDSARFDIIHSKNMDTTFRVAPIYDVGTTSIVTFLDHAGFESTRGANKRAAFSVSGGGKSAGVGILNLFSDYNHNSAAPSQPTVAHSILVGGGDSGLGILNITNGSINAGSCTFQIGLCNGYDGCRGIVNVSGSGRIGLYGTGSVSPSWTSTSIYRFGVGDMNGKSGALTADGELNISENGFVDNRGASFIVGYGSGATGRVNMSGGTVESCVALKTSYGTHADYPDQKFWYTNQVFVVGMAGGEGTWTQTGGSVTSYHRVYVGGCSTNELKVYMQYRDTYKNGVQPNRFPAELKPENWGSNHAARGTVRVLGGSWSCAHECHIGMDGTGLLEIGPTGSFSAKTLCLDANDANDHAANLKFTFGADGVGSINVTNLVIAAGSRVTVDMANVDPSRNGYTLIRAANVEGAFDDADLEVVNKAPGLSSAKVVQTATDLRLVIPRGSVLIFR